MHGRLLRCTQLVTITENIKDRAGSTPLCCARRTGIDNYISHGSIGTLLITKYTPAHPTESVAHNLEHYFHFGIMKTKFCIFYF